jgi:hypothetical protein
MLKMNQINCPPTYFRDIPTKLTVLLPTFVSIKLTVLLPISEIYQQKERETETESLVRVQLLFQCFATHCYTLEKC